MKKEVKKVEQKLETCEKCIDKKLFLILEIKGGMGKGVIATTLVSNLKRKYPNRQIIVVTGWDGIWLNNPDVYRVFNFNELRYFYDDYVNEDTIILKADPYDRDDYIHGRKDLATIWHEMYDIEMVEKSPKLYITPLELNDFAHNINKDNRKILVIHPFGGGEDKSKYTFFRDMHPMVAQEVANQYLKNGWRVIQPKLKNQMAIQGIEHFTSPNQRDLIMLTLLSDRRLLIDSSIQHIAASAAKKSVVLWATNRAKTIFGHDLHTNIVSDKIEKIGNKMTKYAVYEEFNFGGNNIEYPLSQDEQMYDINTIITELDKQ